MLSSVIGLGVLMVLLGVTVNIAVGLWTRSVVDSVAYDAARDVATAPAGSDPASQRAAALDRAAATLGDYGERVELRFETSPDPDLVVLHVVAPPRSFLPRLILGGSVVGGVDHRIVVRREQP